MAAVRIRANQVSAFLAAAIAEAVAEERKACAQLVLDCGIVDDLELRRIADAIHKRGKS